MDENPRKRIPWPIGVVVVFLPVLYVLSIGPVLWMVQKCGLNRGGWPYEIVEAVYVPLGQIVRWTDTNELLFWYVSLFLEVSFGCAVRVPI